MSIMGQSLNKWLNEQTSALHQEIPILDVADIERRLRHEAIHPSTICDTLTLKTRNKMQDIAEESAEALAEIGTPITSDYTLGEKAIGTRDEVTIPRPSGTKGTFHTHPYGSPTPGPHDMIDALSKKDSLVCIGASGYAGNKIACYTPKEPTWSSLRKRLESLDHDMLIFDSMAGKKYKSKGKRLKRLLNSIGNENYIDIVGETPISEYENRVEKAKQRVSSIRTTLKGRRQAITDAKDVLYNAITDQLSIAITDEEKKLAAHKTRKAENNVRLELDRFVLELGMRNDAIADQEEAEKALETARKPLSPEVITRRQEAIRLLQESAALEHRRIELMDEIDDQIRLLGYPKKEQIKPMAFDSCKVTWTMTPEEFWRSLPYEL